MRIAEAILLNMRRHDPGGPKCSTAEELALAYAMAMERRLHPLTTHRKELDASQK